MIRPLTNSHKWGFCSSSKVKRCNHLHVFCVFIAADYRINCRCQSQGAVRGLAPWASGLALVWGFTCARNERVCWENCLWWLRRIIFNTPQVSNKQMERAPQIITNVSACLKCMLWLPVIVFFRLCTSLSRSLSLFSHSAHILSTSPKISHQCVCARLCALDVFLFAVAAYFWLLFLSRLWAACTSSRHRAPQKIH